MATVEQVRNAFAAQIGAAITGLRCYPRWPGDVKYPALLVRPLRLHERLTMGPRAAGASKSVYRLTMLYGPIGTSGGLDKLQEHLDPYLDEAGSKSIIAAVEANKTIGGTCETSNVLGWDNYGSRDVENKDVLGADLDVEVVPL